MKYILFSILLVLNIPTASADWYYEFSPEVKKAYELILSLRLDEAQTHLKKEMDKNPANLASYYVENYIDFFTIFINEDFEEFKKLEENKAYRIGLLKRGDDNSPFHRYMLAEVHLQWALARVKFEENFAAAREVKKAYGLLEENQRRFPNFVANKKSLGILHALIGTIPDNYKWAAKIMGLKGTIKQGMRELKEVIRYSRTNEFIFEEETIVMYGFLMLHLGNAEGEAWDVIRSAKANPATSPLACFVLASVAMHTGRNDEAIRLLENRPEGSAYHPFHYLKYMLGMAKLYRLDQDADDYFLAYLRDFKGQNYIKEAYQKLAWHSLLFNNGTEYAAFMTKCKARGSAIVDEDKKALKEAKYGPKSNPLLLKARLSFDGGYLNKAADFLASKTANSFAETRDQIEYSYRFGRILHKQKKYDEALLNYTKTITDGTNHPWYFACNAALQSGLIHEQRGNSTAAIESFRRCLSMHPDEYKNSLHQKAKAGINRLKR